jgi:enamine deaminase RidA (YjgF/YER057c/UK114 family)
MAQETWRKEVLLQDERGRALAAVVKFGPYLFVAGADGHRDLNTNEIVPELAHQAMDQCRISYGRVAQRLERAGYGGNCAVWIENFSSSQDFRLERMALWPEFFGKEDHGKAVSLGVQAKMSGLNMLTTVAMALTPDVERIPVVPQPHPGRASRCTKAGAFVYVIGVGGVGNPFTHEVAPKEIPEAFGVQTHNTLDWVQSHLSHAGADVPDLVRVDAHLRNVNRAPEYRAYVQQRCGGRLPVATYAVGVAGPTSREHEVGGMAVAPGTPKEIAWWQQDPNVAQAIKADRLVFASGCSGLQDPATGQLRPELYADAPTQARQALRRLEAALQRFGAGLHNVLRLDVFLDDVYFEDQFIEVARDLLGPQPPAMSFVGAQLEHGAAVEVSAIAGAPPA